MSTHPGQARLGEWLRKERVASGLTQEDLAERSGVSVRASALNGSAWNSVQLGDLSEARACCVQAIELCVPVNRVLPR